LQAHQILGDRVDAVDVGFKPDFKVKSKEEGAPVSPNSSPDGRDEVGKRRDPDGRDSELLVSQLETPLVEVPAETSYTTESNGKINIHVSVTINAGTLAELKKQRAQNRNSSPDISSVLSGRTSANDSDIDALAVKRFSGDTSENIIDDSKAKRCCSIL